MGERHTDFFDRIVADPPAALRKFHATVRFDVDDGPSTEHWLLTIDHGTVRVARRKARADAVIRFDRELFERVLAGQDNPMAAMLRGSISIDGDPELLVVLQRLIPGPSRGKPA